MVKLDLIDRKLMYELDIDARLSFSQLAKKINKSQEVVRYRLNRLIKRGIIERFMTVIDIGKVGFYHYEIYIRFQKLSDEKEKEFIEFVTKLSNILWVVSCSGHYDVVFSIIARDNIHFSHVLSKVTEKFGEFIAERNIQFNIRIPHFSRVFLVPEKKVKEELSFSSTIHDRANIDNIDFKILRTIVNNGRMPIVDISKKLDLGIDVVKYRIKNLRKIGVIQTFRPLYNKEKMGYLLYQMLFSFRNLNDSLKNSFIEFCKNTNNIVYVMDTIGKYDLIVELEPKTQRDFDNILKKIRNKFSEHIISYETISVIKEHQMDYFKVDEKEYLSYED